MKLARLPVHWTNDHRQWYRKVYLRSDHWRNLRDSKLAISKSCEHCGSVRKLDVHHVNYRSIFDVQVSDLLTLCRICHDQEHQINGFPKRSRSPLLKSQKQFPDPARFAITAKTVPELRKFEAFLEGLKLKGKSLHEHHRKRLNDLRRMVAIGAE